MDTQNETKARLWKQLAFEYLAHENDLFAVPPLLIIMLHRDSKGSADTTNTETINKQQL